MVYIFKEGMKILSGTKKEIWDDIKLMIARLFIGILRSNFLVQVPLNMTNNITLLH